MLRALSPSDLAVLNGDDPNVRWMASQTRRTGHDVRVRAAQRRTRQRRRARLADRGPLHAARRRRAAARLGAVAAAGTRCTRCSPGSPSPSRRASRSTSRSPRLGGAATGIEPARARGTVGRRDPPVRPLQVVARDRRCGARRSRGDPGPPQDRRCSATSTSLRPTRSPRSKRCTSGSADGWRRVADTRSFRERRRRRTPTPLHGGALGGRAGAGGDRPRSRRHGCGPRPARRICARATWYWSRARRSSTSTGSDWPLGADRPLRRAGLHRLDALRQLPDARAGMGHGGRNARTVPNVSDAPWTGDCCSLVDAFRSGRALARRGAAMRRSPRSRRPTSTASRSLDADAGARRPRRGRRVEAVRRRTHRDQGAGAGRGLAVDRGVARVPATAARRTRRTTSSGSSRRRCGARSGSPPPASSAG